MRQKNNESRGGDDFLILVVPEGAVITVKIQITTSVVLPVRSIVSRARYSPCKIRE